MIVMTVSGPLFSPIRYGTIEAPKRIVMAPMTRTRAAVRLFNTAAAQGFAEANLTAVRTLYQ